MALYEPNNDRPFPFSRSKIALFIECPRCLYLEARLGVRRPSGPGFALNAAVDTLLKREFDRWRTVGVPHPYMTKHGLKAMPAQHEMLDQWRNTRIGVRSLHKRSNLLVYGAIDDLWREGDHYIVVDYKATAKKEPVVTLSEPWHEGYKRQLEVYQWALRRQGLEVSNTGYFVYCRGRSELPSFDEHIEFDVKLILHEGHDDWVEPVLMAAKKCLDSPHPPRASRECKFCAYREASAKALLQAK